MHKPLVLVSNDDGIAAAGLRTLADALESVAEVWVVAPTVERSAVSHAISLHNPLRVAEVAPRRFACDGTPTDSVYLGLHHLLPRPPDLVVSGINHGPNLGNDVLYSGTVSAAMEGALFGFPAIAMSLCLPEKITADTPPTWRFDTAAEVAVALAKKALSGVHMPPGVLLNVNVPNRPRPQLEGVKLCRLGYTDWTDVVTERHDPRGKPYYWIGGERLGHDEIVDSDNNAVVAGFVSVTPVHYDLTDYRSFAYVRDALAGIGYENAPDRLGNDPLPHPVHPRLHGRRPRA